LRLIIFLALLLTGCSTHSEKLRADYSLTSDTKLLEAPFIAQTKYQCGPAALAMAANYVDKNVEVNQLSEMLYTPKSQGTYQNDLLAATRRLGLLAVPVSNMKQLFHELNNSHPILVFQNLGLSWIPKWHYALVIGYDLKSNEILMHSGEIKNFRLKISTFESTWGRVNHWGLVILQPGTLLETATESDMVAATAGLETAGQSLFAKKSYEVILDKWPTSLGALVGLGNIYYQLNDLENSRINLKKAILAHPEASGAWYNYAIILSALKRSQEAEAALKKFNELKKIN
jgi:hypothetical protein